VGVRRQRVTVPAGPILDACRDAGFALAGVCPAEPSAFADEYRRWIDAGRHGSMAYLARNLDVRLDPRVFLPGARSIIMVADQYERRPAPAGSEDAPHRPAGRIARYARGRDYHGVMKKRLHALCDALRDEHPAAEFRAFVDTAPILEREHAARAGLGWVGKHTLLIHPRLGSWLFLGGIATTLDLTPAPEQQPVTDHCGACTRCIDACPTGAITPYSVDATRCIAYLTIEHRGEIDPDLRGLIGGRVFGCDDCQEVCPHNSHRPGDVGEPHPAYTPRQETLDPLAVLEWSEEDRRRVLGGSAMTRATLAMLKRNAVVTLSNTPGAIGNPAVRAAITRLRDDPAEPTLARAAAAQALG